MNIIRNISLVGIIKVLSKIMALIRDRVIAVTVGASSQADLFFLAFNTSNGLKQVVGEESLKASFLPLFTEYHEEKEGEETWEMVNTVINTLLVLIVFIAVGSIVLSPLIIGLVGFGLKDLGSFRIAVGILRVLTPMVVFSSMAMLLFCMLTALGRFTIPAGLPLVMNVLIIFVTLFLYPYCGVYALAIGVVAGSIMQAVVQLPQLYAYGYRYRFTLNWRHPALNRLFRLMVPVVITQGLLHITILMDTAFASTLQVGSISSLYYGNRVMLFPYDIIGLAIAMVVFPELAKEAVHNDLQRLQETFQVALRLLLFFGVPATLGMITLARPVVAALFGGKQFGAVALSGASAALVWYMAGLIGFAGIRIVTLVYYSFKDTKTPLYIGIVCLGLNGIFDFLLIKVMSFGGLALASSIVASLNLVILIMILRRRLKSIQWGPMIRTLGQSVIASIIMLLAIIWLNSTVFERYGVYIQAGAGVTMGAVIYLILMRLFKNQELQLINNAFKN